MRETTKRRARPSSQISKNIPQASVCLTGGDEGPLAAALMRGGEAAGLEVVEQLVRIFGQQNVYVELQRHREREEEGAIRLRCASHGRCICRCSRPTVYAMPPAMTERSSIYLRRSAITLNLTTPGACSR